MRRRVPLAVRERMKESLRATLARLGEVDFAYLFGSFVEAEAFEDVDVAIYVEGSETWGTYERFCFAMRVGRELEKALEPRVEVEVHLLNEAPLAFQYRVLQTGQLLFVREEVKRIRYEAGKMSDYLDYKPVLEWFNRQYLERSR